MGLVSHPPTPTPEVTAHLKAIRLIADTFEVFVEWRRLVEAIGILG